MTLDHDAIAARIPHAGRMCLLHEVTRWDDTQLRARAISHRDGANPLRCDQGLACTAGIEYAAQAMAVHGSLLSGDRPRAGRLASTRGVTAQVRWLDRVTDDLVITVSRISGDDTGMVYDFEIRAADALLMSGRASVALMPAAAS